MEKVYFNNEFVNWKEAYTHIEDRSYQFGDGVYEVIKILNGKALWLEEHIERLFSSANKISIKMNTSISDIEKKIEKLININNINEGITYIQISRGVNQRSHDFPNPAVAPVMIAYTRELYRPIEKQKSGISAIFQDDIRWLRNDIKSINLLGSVLAKEEANKKGAEEAVLHRSNTITEGSATNFFIVKKGVIYTHPVNNYILNGITRLKVLELAEQLKIEAREEPFLKEDVLQGEEAFITSTTKDIVPVIKIDNNCIGNGSPGKVTMKLQEAFENLLSRLL
ncbi:D-amino-acid transaminase [Salibacterium aidingense]|uniref:D-amino-acid transaminase n=1 Tax=Salibacterium aidingense TaxID=384933 RepID=UPI000425262E|nr:D-amino-acid transaminase [Salibacterium aidingense]